MTTVKHLMSVKSDVVNYTLPKTESVLKALEVMNDANISAVVVTEGDKVIGIFTERDYSRKCEIKGLSAKETLLKDVMTGDMITVNPDITIAKCMELMRQYHIRHLPVLEDDKMFGMVSMRDVVDMILSDKESMIRGLENYIIGTRFSS